MDKPPNPPRSGEACTWAGTPRSYKEESGKRLEMSRKKTAACLPAPSVAAVLYELMQFQRILKEHGIS